MGRTNKATASVRLKWVLFWACVFRIASSLVWKLIDPLKVKYNGAYLDMSKVDFEGGYLFSQGVSVFECAALLAVTVNEKQMDFKRAWRFCLIAALFDLFRQFARTSYDLPLYEYWGFIGALILELIVFAIQKLKK